MALESFSRPKQTEVVYKLTFFIIAALLIKPKQQHGKTKTKTLVFL
jgi:hypothetical protein